MLTGFALVSVLVLLIGLQYEQKRQVENRGVSQQGVGMLKRVEYEGKTYVEKTALSSFLLLGTDQIGQEVGYGARQGGQADFLMLVVIDHNERKISQLQIDRDTITEVETLGILGNPIGTKPMQISLAHIFGTSREENSGFVQRAVENLLEGIKIDACAVLSMNAIGRLNDALGGVTVTLDEDLSYADPEMAQGRTIRLNASQAELLVRGRMQLGDGSNESRMRRQRLFISGAVQAFREGMKEDAGFMDHIIETVGDDLFIGTQRAVLLNEINRAYHYEVLAVETLAGEYAIGKDGFMEFHTAPGAAAQWVIKTFYEVD